MPLTPEQEELQKTKDALNQIDASTTAAGTAITQIAANQQTLLQRIADAITAGGSDSLAQAQALTTQAQGEAMKLADVAAFMNQVASQGADNPVPIPAPVVDTIPSDGQTDTTPNVV